MRFSSKSKYALCLMVELASRKTDDVINLKAIFHQHEVSLKYMEQIIPLLKKERLILSTRGALGGYRLARKAATITAGDILRATEGCLSVLNHENESARISEKCGAVIDFFSGLNDVIYQYFDSVSLEELSNKNGAELRLPEYFI